MLEIYKEQNCISFWVEDYMNGWYHAHSSVCFGKLSSNLYEIKNIKWFREEDRYSNLLEVIINFIKTETTMDLVGAE